MRTQSEAIAEALPASMAGLTFDVLGYAAAVKLCVDRGGRHVPGDGKADIVITAEVSQQRNPLAHIDALAQRARRILIVITPRSGFAGITAAGLGWQLLLDHPALALWPGKRRGRRNQEFYFTQTFLARYLKDLRQDFSSVKQINCNEKIIIVVERRSINRLTILAGVPAIGKSTLLKALQDGDVPATEALAARIDIGKAELATYTSLLKTGPSHHDDLLVQYNITAPLTHGPLYRYENGIADLIGSAERPRVITMWLPASSLLERYKNQRVPGAAGGASSIKARKSESKLRDVGGRRSVNNILATLGLHVRSRHMRLKDERFASLYADPEAVAALYRRWFNFLAECACESHVLIQEPEYTLLPLAEWLRLQEKH
jgi:hypothetical protein